MCVCAMFVQILRESSRVFRAGVTNSCEMPSQLLGTEFKSSRKSASTLTTESFRFSETGSLCFSQARLEFPVFLPELPQCRDHRCVVSCSAWVGISDGGAELGHRCAHI